MNERIKELYQQSHSIRYYDNDPALEGNPPTVYWQGEVSAQRFAELIVRECLKFVEPDQTSGDEWCVTLDETAQSIKQHFGVEE